MADLLVVDNDARIADLVALYLQREGHSPRVVTSYAAAREALGVRSFALMLADLELGAEDGRVELPRLEAEGLLPKTLVVSGYLDAEITEGLLQIPSVVGTVPKPFEPSELLARVNEALLSGSEGATASAEEGTTLREVVIQPSPAPISEQEAAPAADEDGWVEISPRREVEPSAMTVEPSAMTVEPSAMTVEPSAMAVEPSAEIEGPSEVLAEEEDWEGVG